jgi:hypothetical protein
MNNWNFPKTTNIKWKTKQNKKIKCMWNERHGKCNWNKDGFRVYLGHHLKEVGISPNPHSNFLQTIWTKNKMNIENYIRTMKWAWTIFAQGKPFNNGHNWEARSNHCTLFLDNSHPLNGSRKSLFHFEFQRALLGSSLMSNVWSLCP